MQARARVAVLQNFFGDSSPVAKTTITTRPEQGGQVVR